MNRTELSRRVAARLPDLPNQDVDQAIKVLLNQLSTTLATGGRCEIRGFGTFSLHIWQARVARNPKTGRSVTMSERYIPHFKPGKLLRESVNQGRTNNPIRN